MLNIFVNTWGNYNENGADGGEWLTLPMENEELQSELDRISANFDEIDHEWFINDYEFTSDFEFKIDENDGIFELNEIIDALYDLNGYEQDKLQAISEVENISIDNILEWIEKLEDVEFYRDMTLEDVAEQIVDECYNLDEFARRYFDYKAFARDLRYDGYMEANSGVIRI